MKLDDGNKIIINAIIATALGCQVEEVQSDKHLCYDLLADSLALLDITLALEERFSIHFEQQSLTKINYVQDLYKFVDMFLSTENVQEGRIG